MTEEPVEAEDVEVQKAVGKLVSKLMEVDSDE